MGREGKSGKEERLKRWKTIKKTREGSKRKRKAGRKRGRKAGEDNEMKERVRKVRLLEERMGTFKRKVGREERKRKIKKRKG